MSVNKGFGKSIEKVVNQLVANAEIHNETHHIAFKTPDLPKGITEQSLENHVNFLNNTQLAVEVATNQIAAEQYPETKHEAWDSRLDLYGIATVASDVRLREEVEGQASFGISTSSLCHPFSDEATNWYGDWVATNAARAEALFKD